MSLFVENADIYGGVAGALDLRQQEIPNLAHRLFVMNDLQCYLGPDGEGVGARARPSGLRPPSPEHHRPEDRGPARDLVGLGHYSNPSRLLGFDVSSMALSLARERVALNTIKAELTQMNESAESLPFEERSIDYIHCSGVLHHVPHPLMVVREFSRIMRPEGLCRGDGIQLRQHPAASQRRLSEAVCET